MKKGSLLRLFTILSLSTIIYSCESSSSDDLVGNWVDKYKLEGVARSHAASFSTDSKGYIVTGYDGDDRVRLTDSWEYNPEKNQWIRKADFPGVGRTSSIGFSINNEGYVGTGYDGTNKLIDFWKFDPTGNTWTKVADFPGSARYGAVGFSIGSKGYLLGGYDGNYLKDLWEYDSETGKLDPENKFTRK